MSPTRSTKEVKTPADLCYGYKPQKVAHIWLQSLCLDTTAEKKKVE